MSSPLLRAVTGRLLIESHRGSSCGPPNSWAAIRSGLSRGADLIEVDVQVSQDGVAFLYHDYVLPDGRWTHRTCWSDLRDAGSGGAPFVLLQDLLAWAVSSSAFLVLDVKSGFRPPGSSHEIVARSIRQAGAEDRVLVSDRDHHEVRATKEAHPGIMTRASLGARLADLTGVIRAVHPEAVTMRWDLCRGDDVEIAHGLGVAVVFVDGWHPDYFGAALRLGVDVVTCGDPSEAREHLRRASA